MLILKRCSKLETLVINKVGFSIFKFDMIRYQFFKGAITAVKKISRVSVQLDNFDVIQATSWSFLLMKLPRLTEIELLKNSYPVQHQPAWHKIILRGLCEYLKKYGASGCLKVS